MAMHAMNTTTYTRASTPSAFKMRLSMKFLFSFLLACAPTAQAVCYAPAQDGVSKLISYIPSTIHIQFQVLTLIYLKILFRPIVFKATPIHTLAERTKSVIGRGTIMTVLAKQKKPASTTWL